MFKRLEDGSLVTPAQWCGIGLPRVTRCPDGGHKWKTLLLSDSVSEIADGLVGGTARDYRQAQQRCEVCGFDRIQLLPKEKQMDPEANRKEQEATARRIVEIFDLADPEGGYSAEQEAELCGLAVRLAELVLAAVAFERRGGD